MQVLVDLGPDESIFSSSLEEEFQDDVNKASSLGDFLNWDDLSSKFVRWWDDLNATQEDWWSESSHEDLGFKI